MPWGDRTGPWSYGPKTGRGMGFCGGYGRPGRFNGPWQGSRRGGGNWPWWKGWRHWMPFGFGGFCKWAFGRPNQETEKEYLNEGIKVMEEHLESMKKRLQELEAEGR